MYSSASSRSSGCSAVGLQRERIFEPRRIPVRTRARRVAFERKLIEPSDPTIRDAAKSRKLASCNAEVRTERIERRVIADQRPQICGEGEGVDSLAVEQRVPDEAGVVRRWILRRLDLRGIALEQLGNCARQTCCAQLAHQLLTRLCVELGVSEQHLLALDHRFDWRRSANRLGRRVAADQ